MKHCFVGFFGLNRSLQWTLPSIQNNLLRPLRESGFELCLAGHFNCPEVIENARSRENGIPLDMSLVHRLDLHLQWMERQQEASIHALLPHVLKVPYRGFKDADGQTRKNALHQLHSLKQLHRMVNLLDRDRFEFYCLFRPDLEYLDPIPVNQIVADMVKGRDVLTPAWHRWGGLNDRFAICSRRGLDAYLSRIEGIIEFCQTRGFFHSERFLAHVIRNAKLSTGFLPTRARRIRSTGEVWQDGFQ